MGRIVDVKQLARFGPSVQRGERLDFSFRDASNDVTRPEFVGMR